MANKFRNDFFLLFLKYRKILFFRKEESVPSSDIYIMLLFVSSVLEKSFYMNGDAAVSKICHQLWKACFSHKL